MDCTFYSSDSEEALDKEELEVALYAQIHYGTGITNDTGSNSQDFYNDRVMLPFEVGVKELPARVIPNFREQPIFCGEFISFSNKTVCDKNSDRDTKEHDLIANFTPSAISSSHSGCSKNVESGGKKTSPGKNQEKMTIIDEQRYSGSKNKSALASINKVKSECEKIPCFSKETAAKVFRGQNKTAAKIINQPSVKVPDEGESKILGKFIQVKHPEQKGKKVQTLFPFCITKVRKKTLTVESLNSKEEKNSKDIVCKDESSSAGTSKIAKLESFLELPKPETVIKMSKKKKGLNKLNAAVKEEKNSKDIVCKDESSSAGTSKIAKLESFLELPKPETVIKMSKKKKGLNKLNAAVKPREPPVRLRRPPVVTVKFKEESDTNTDYSDSEASSNPSPEKHKKSSSSASSTSMEIESSNLAFSVPVEGLVENKHEKKAGAQARVKLEPVNDLNSAEDGVDTEEEDEIYSHFVEEGEDENDKATSCSSDEASDSEDTDSSDPAEFLSETEPNLEFNLEGGVKRLLAAPMNLAPSKWKIDEKDRLNLNSLLSRYFSPKTIQCRNCKREGHTSRNCSEPMKRPCIFCGIEGHDYKSCLNVICYNCDAPGHRTTECKEPKRNWNVNCSRCWMPGHEEKVCPDKWRQYHITVNRKGLVTSSKSAKNPLVSCYNCGKKGHLGYECLLPRMNQYVPANYPFIARYDTKKKHKQDRQAWVHGARDSKESTQHHSDRQFEEHTGRGKEYDPSRSFERSKNIRESPERKKTKMKKKKKMKEKDGDHHYHNPGQACKRRADDKDEHSWSRERKRMRKDDSQMTGSARIWERGYQETSDINQGSLFGKQGWPQDTPGRKYKSRERKETMEDDYLEDLESHQVNSNDWWNNPGKKRRQWNKRGADWRSDERDLETFRNTTGKITNNSRGAPTQGSRRKGKEKWPNDTWWKASEGTSSSFDSKPFYQSKRNQGMQHFPSSDNIHQWDSPSSRFPDLARQDFASDNSSKQGRLKHSTSWPVVENAKYGFKVQNIRM